MDQITKTVPVLEQIWETTYLPDWQDFQQHQRESILSILSQMVMCQIADMKIIQEADDERE